MKMSKVTDYAALNCLPASVDACNRGWVVGGGMHASMPSWYISATKLKQKLLIISLHTSFLLYTLLREKNSWYTILVLQDTWDELFLSYLEEFAVLRQEHNLIKKTFKSVRFKCSAFGLIRK